MSLNPTFGADWILSGTLAGLGAAIGENLSALTTADLLAVQTGLEAAREELSSDSEVQEEAVRLIRRCGKHIEAENRSGLAEDWLRLNVLLKGSISEKPDVVGSDPPLPASLSIEDLSLARERIHSARNVLFITGAGVSAESGVPTFRGAGGLWREHDVTQVANPRAFAENPRFVWEFYQFRREGLLGVAPNMGHYAVAGFERGFDEGVTLFTQNVDGLHADAGSPEPVEVHGNIWTTRCTGCGEIREDRRVPFPELPPKCDCGENLRPHIVWFGENYDPLILSQMEEATARADVVLLVGTSGFVAFSPMMARAAKNNGAFIIEVNTERTDMITPLADVTLLGKSGEILPPLLEPVRDEEKNLSFARRLRLGIVARILAQRVLFSGNAQTLADGLSRRPPEEQRQLALSCWNLIAENHPRLDEAAVQILEVLFPLMRQRDLKIFGKQTVPVLLKTKDPHRLLPQISVLRSLIGVLHRKHLSPYFDLFAALLRKQNSIIRTEVSCIVRDTFIPKLGRRQCSLFAQKLLDRNEWGVLGATFPFLDKARCAKLVDDLLAGYPNAEDEETHRGILHTLGAAAAFAAGNRENLIFALVEQGLKDDSASVRSEAIDILLLLFDRIAPETMIGYIETVFRENRGNQEDLFPRLVYLLQRVIGEYDADTNVSPLIEILEARTTDSETRKARPVETKMFEMETTKALRLLYESFDASFREKTAAVATLNNTRLPLEKRETALYRLARAYGGKLSYGALRLLILRGKRMIRGNESYIAFDSESAEEIEAELALPIGVRLKNTAEHWSAVEELLKGHPALGGKIRLREGTPFPAGFLKGATPVINDETEPLLLWPLRDPSMQAANVVEILEALPDGKAVDYHLSLSLSGEVGDDLIPAALGLQAIVPPMEWPESLEGAPGLDWFAPVVNSGEGGAMGHVRINGTDSGAHYDYLFWPFQHPPSPNRLEASDAWSMPFEEFLQQVEPKIVKTDSEKRAVTFQITSAGTRVNGTFYMTQEDWSLTESEEYIVKALFIRMAKEVALNRLGEAIESAWVLGMLRETVRRGEEALPFSRGFTADKRKKLEALLDEYRRNLKDILEEEGLADILETPWVGNPNWSEVRKGLVRYQAALEVRPEVGEAIRTLIGETVDETSEILLGDI